MPHIHEPSRAAWSGRRPAGFCRAAIVALALSAAIGSCATLPRPLPAVPSRLWREDLATFAREMPKHHKNAFHHVSRDSFERAVASLDKRIPTLTDADIFFELRRITAAIGDGHTGLFYPTNFHRYPIAFGRFGDEYRVTRVSEEGRALLGGKLTRIGDVPVAEVEDRLRAIVSQDENPWYVRSSLLQWLLITEALHWAGVAPDTARLAYTVEDSSGRLVSATLRPEPLGSPAPSVSARADTPLYARQRAAPLWFVPLAHDSCVYASFTGYKKLSPLARSMWRYVDRHPGVTLIVDMRLNHGGNFITGRRALVDPARKRLEARKLGKLVVLIGNATFSAAMVNAIDFRKRCHATLAGEPIGERPNSYSERGLFILPHSKLVVTYSRRYYRFQDSDDPPTVMPDITIAPTWDEFRAGRDPVLEWALAHRAER